MNALGAESASEAESELKPSCAPMSKSRRGCNTLAMHSFAASTAHRKERIGSTVDVRSGNSESEPA
jgi:hypothetical protein